ncbi:hypothetical protein AU195_13785 [Mycobacterium sp. IS-1496]|nr:hypothetical protein AU195_13785 [Mycobacterium sp. IS-1496]
MVFTGGTIGSRIASDVINVVPGQTYRLIDDYTRAGTTPVHFDVIEPVSILSENARPRDWSAITRAITANVAAEHAGVIVTHGTDTLSYSAAALTFALTDLRIPVVMVASDLPLEDPSANGSANFRDAVDIIGRGFPSGVYVTYRNPDGRRLVHLGVRTLPPSPLDHFVYSACGRHLTESEGDGPHQWSASDIPGPRLSTDPQVRGNHEFSENVLLVRPYPGLNYDRLDISGCDAVVHDLYHSGTASAGGSPAQNILNFASRCRAADIPLFCAPVPDNVGTYDSSGAFSSAGVVSAGQMRSEVAYVKASFGAGAGLRGEKLIEFVCQRSLAEEFLEIPGR